MASQNPLQCLAQIQADLPKWLERVDALAETVNARYAEWVRESKQRQRSPTPLKKNKTGSMESLRPKDEEERKASKSASPEPESSQAIAVSLQPLQSSQPTTPAAANPADIDPSNRHLFREIREQRRKRKNPSLKDGASGPSRSRHCGGLTIWYDSSVQKDFELLVRNISGARNTLRKGKTAASFRTRFSGLKDEESPYGTDATPYQFQMRTVPRLSQPGSSYLTGLKTGLEIYDQLDRELESSQTLCEVGAHQFLRDGDCFEELRSTRAKFEECTRLLSKEIKSLEEQEDIDKAMGLYSNETDVDQRLPPRPKRIHSGLDPEGVAIDGPIEADENADQESIEIDLMKLPGRRHYSSRHIMMEISAAELRKSVHASPALEKASPLDQAEEGIIADESRRKESNLPQIEAIAVAGDIPSAANDPDLAAMRRSIGRRAPSATSETSPSSSNKQPVLSTEVDAAMVAIEPQSGIFSEGASEPDLRAMMKSIGRRTTPAAFGHVDTNISSSVVNDSLMIASIRPPTAADNTEIIADDTTANGSTGSEDDSELDLTAMRASIKSRPPRQTSALKNISEQANAEALVKKIRESKLKYRRSSDKIGNHDPYGNEIPVVPEFAVDTHMVSAADERDQEDLGISPQLVEILKRVPKAQKA